MSATPENKRGIVNMAARMDVSNVDDDTMPQDFIPFLLAEALFRRAILYEKEDEPSSATLDKWEKLGLQALTMCTLMWATADVELVRLSAERLKTLVGDDEDMKYMVEMTDEDVELFLSTTAKGTSGWAKLAEADAPGKKTES
ncbi:hypothetical protein P7C70_g3825, partial [Phenoliferia sp. Uapishka_3]